MKRRLLDYKSAIKPVWCAGCGNYAVLTAVQRSLAVLDIPPEDIVTVSGIGCSGRFSHYMNTYSLHGTHGRAVPTSVGIKAARPDLTVLTVGGDGDGLGIGETVTFKTLVDQNRCDHRVVRDNHHCPKFTDRPGNAHDYADKNAPGGQREGDVYECPGEGGPKAP